jgi:hypothetical protein
MGIVFLLLNTFDKADRRLAKAVLDIVSLISLFGIMFVIFVYAHDATIGRWLIFAICLLEDGLLILMNLFIHKIRIQKYEKANGKTKKMCKNFFINR